MGRHPSLSPTERQHAIELREAGKSLQEVGEVAWLNRSRHEPDWYTILDVEDKAEETINLYVSLILIAALSTSSATALVAPVSRPR
jgi:hypothetical protein